MPTIGVCTSARESNIKGLLSELKKITDVRVKFIQLPYNDLKNYRLPADEINGVILCHSIHNRRFAITDVMDALYNDFLPHAAATLGKSNIAVIGHDFQWPFKSADSRSSHSQLKEEKMASFRIQQPTAFECSSLAMICGRLEKKLEMDEEDWKQLETFTTNVHKVKPMPNSFGGDQAGTVLTIVAGIVIFMLAQYLVSVCIKLIVSGIYKVVIIVLVALVVIPVLCFFWQKFVVEGRLSGPLPARNLSRPSIHQWHAYPWWQVPFRFWQFYTPQGISCVQGLPQEDYVLACAGSFVCLLGGYKVLIVVVVAFAVIPVPCFLWQKYVSEHRKSGPLPARNLSRLSIHQWYAYPLLEVHIRFWQFYTPKLIRHAESQVKKLTDYLRQGDYVSAGIVLFVYLFVCLSVYKIT